MGGPVPLLALGAAVTRHLAAAADVELPQLWKDKEQGHFLGLKGQTVKCFVAVIPGKNFTRQNVGLDLEGQV